MRGWLVASKGSKSQVILINTVLRCMTEDTQRLPGKDDGWSSKR